MKKIAIVLATYRLDRNVMQHFISWNKDVFVKHQVKVKMVCDRIEKFNEDWVDIIVYPYKQNIFSIGRTVNYGIRNVEANVDIVIKTDPDIFFSNEVLEFVKSKVKYKEGVICLCANMKNIDCAKQANWDLCTIRRVGRGACFAMTRQDWFELKGYDERIEGWGGDDFELYRRASSKIKITENADFPLFHINHPSRKTSGNDYFSIQSKKNLQIGKKLDWNDDNWGTGKFSK